MFLAASRLLRPLNYLKISGYSLGKFHWGYPALFTAITLIYIILYPDNISLLTGNDSFLSGLLSCLNLLPGFYITALAAVATFNRKAMDEEIDGVTATLKAQENGQVKIRSLTRRRFLCYLFGYLSFISLFLLIAGIIIKVAPPTAFIPTSLNCYKVEIEYLLVGAYIYLFYQMIMVTLVGLFYLSDRMRWKRQETKIQ